MRRQGVGLTAGMAAWMGDLAEAGALRAAAIWLYYFEDVFLFLMFAINHLGGGSLVRGCYRLMTQRERGSC